MFKIFKTILTIALISVSGYLLYTNFQDAWPTLQAKYFPCKSPIAYTLGSFDSKFGLSQQDFLTVIQQAEVTWEKAIDLELFVYKADDHSPNILKVNLIYDSRQAATEKIRALGLSVSDTRASYDDLRAKYAVMQKDYLQAKSDYQKKRNTFESEQNAYQKKVEYWNSRGGAPKGTYEELKSEGESLKAELATLQAMEKDLNTQVDNINALVNVINNLARTLNINAEELNNIGQSRGEEFTEGEYISDSSGREIDVYEFSTKAKLQSLLSHELGHALGLEHVSDPEAVMYYLNESKNGQITPADLSELKKVCRLK